MTEDEPILEEPPDEPDDDDDEPAGTERSDFERDQMAAPSDWYVTEWSWS